ncbi:hypothetical protein [Propionispora vibrioides]|uniref:Uncharacterized protein n=1 Tax=Propionispora vibrioides TaxID=112903 RepID=A0A1H8RUS9_9FIRM|nr:hypothetical protein [Propionispora vibrioides]SEO70130.1 hypothetical protein SAMN04490178_10488 [Propionispora vibrioides]
MKKLEMIGQLADLKEIDYKNTLSISVLLELLIEKNLITRQDFAQKARELEAATLAEIILSRRSQTPVTSSPSPLNP